jgi:hypothetical protein
LLLHPAKMFEPVRGGTRGGQAEFKWSDVSADKDREVSHSATVFVMSQYSHCFQNYLGHSINAPTGRWQKNKDVHWYNRDISEDAATRAEEVRKVKEAEAEALSAALYVLASSSRYYPWVDTITYFCTEDLHQHPSQLSMRPPQVPMQLLLLQNPIPKKLHRR